MRRRMRTGLLRLPGGMGYRMARALHMRERPPDRANKPEATARLEVALEGAGRHKRLRVRAAGDIWSDEFRDELARDRRFEGRLVWKELAILAFIAAVLVARILAS